VAVSPPGHWPRCRPRPGLYRVRYPTSSCTSAKRAGVSGHESGRELRAYAAGGYEIIPAVGWGRCAKFLDRDRPGAMDPARGGDRDRVDWSQPMALGSGGELPSAGGVYRLWAPGVESLVYVGESVTLSDRLATHRRERHSELLVSYVLCVEAETFQLQQLESTVLGAHWLACGVAPKGQY
jgi:hypothetical protein